MNINIIGRIGSKVHLRTIIKLFFDDNKKFYIEPFGGSCAVGLSCSSFKQRIFSELDNRLIFLANYLKEENETTQLFTVLNKIYNDSEAIFLEAKQVLSIPNYFQVIDNKERLNYAEKIIISLLCSFNKTGNHFVNIDKKRYISGINKLRKVSQYLQLNKKNITFLNESAFETLKRFKNETNCQFYCDPPYVGLYRQSRSLYKYEFFSLIDHINLLNALLNVKGRVVLSGFRPPDNIPCLYDVILGTDYKCYKLGIHKNKAKKGSTNVIEEYIWTNFSPPHAYLFTSLTDYSQPMDWNEYILTIRRIYKNDSKILNEYEEAFKYNEILKKGEVL